VALSCAPSRAPEPRNDLRPRALRPDLRPERCAGTFFEHMGADNLVEMEQGQCTFRPGSVRHGGNKVTYYSLLTTNYLLLTTDYILLTAYHLPLTTYHLLLTAATR